MISSSNGSVSAGPSRPWARCEASGQRLLATVLCLMLLGPGWTVTASSSASAQKLSYNRDVRPILSENCFACHGPDKNQRKGKLRLDVREAALDKRAIVPGKPDESELVKRLHTTNPDDIMPPPESHKTLTPGQKELLERWIAEGAEYEPHWAYIKPIRPEVPGTKNSERVRNPIDAFILHGLETKGIQPASEAVRRTLLR